MKQISNVYLGNHIRSNHNLFLATTSQFGIPHGLFRRVEVPARQGWFVQEGRDGDA